MVCSGSCTSPSEGASEWSTDATRLGMGEAALALRSWQSTLENPELQFNPVGDPPLWSPPFVFLTLSVGHISVQVLTSKHDSNSSWIQLNTYKSTKAHKRETRRWII